LVRSIAEGAAEQAKEEQQTLKDTHDAIQDPLTWSHSPAPYFIDQGHGIIEGLMQGFKDRTSQLGDELQSLVTLIQGYLSPTNLIGGFTAGSGMIGADGGMGADVGGSLVSAALTQLNKPYEWGSAAGRSDFSVDPSGFDCSGFVAWVYKTVLGVTIPAFTGSLQKELTQIDPNQARAGDVVLFGMNQSDPTKQHAALYMGGGKIVEAGGTGRNVNVANITDVGEPLTGFFRSPQVDAIAASKAAGMGRNAATWGAGGSAATNSHASFVNSMMPLAQQWAAKTGIPAEYFIAANISESNWGAAPGNELFGIKAHAGVASTGPLGTWEAGQGAVNASFAAYPSANAAYADFVRLISTSPTYAAAWAQFQKDHDPDALFRNINAAGYATDPSWGGKISSLAKSTVPGLVSRQFGGPILETVFGMGSQTKLPYIFGEGGDVESYSSRMGSGGRGDTHFTISPDAFRGAVVVQGGGANVGELVTDALADRFMSKVADLWLDAHGNTPVRRPGVG
jgi:hypothetical protein